MQISILIGIDSDLFFSAEENRETFKKLALIKKNVTYNEIKSVHSHDAFLIEYKQLEKIIEPIFNIFYKKKRMKILKFGGTSLANGKGINSVINIITSKVKSKDKIVVVTFARGNTKDILENILEKSINKQDYKLYFENFKKNQLEPNIKIDLSKEFLILENIFERVKLLGDCSKKIKDEVLAQGELLLVKMLVSLLKNKKINAKVTDARKLIITDDNFGNANPVNETSKERVVKYFKKLS